MKGVSCRSVYFCARDAPPPSPFAPHPISSSGIKPQDSLSAAELNVCPLNIYNDRQDYSVSLVPGVSSLQDRGA